MPKKVSNTDEFRGAQFTMVDLSGAILRDVDLSGAKILDALLTNTELSGMISGLRVNGVEVAPLVEAELDRRHPERVALRATTPSGLRDAWAVVESMWRPTIELAWRLPETARQQRVDDEWSLVETLRHLIFVVDAWFGRTVLGDAEPYHRLGLTPPCSTACTSSWTRSGTTTNTPPATSPSSRDSLIAALQIA